MAAVEWVAPKLVVFGHDHNTSRRKKIWNHKLASGTTCINVGQDSPLRYTVIEMKYASEKPSLPTQVVIQAAYRRGRIFDLERLKADTADSIDDLSPGLPAGLLEE